MTLKEELAQWRKQKKYRAEALPDELRNKILSFYETNYVNGDWRADEMSEYLGISSTSLPNYVKNIYKSLNRPYIPKIKKPNRKSNIPSSKNELDALIEEMEKDLTVLKEAREVLSKILA